MMEITPGRYRHFKGKEYEVVGVARHSETLEEYVVYRALYASEFGANALWIRPAAMFAESVQKDGALVPRFARID
jgi:cyclomaltodextrinase / maltogenic alpha-amylase / neopullulanase